MYIFRTSRHNKEYIGILHIYGHILLADRFIEYGYNVHIYIESMAIHHCFTNSMMW